MKSIFIIISILFFSSSFSQNYIPFDTISFDKRNAFLKEFKIRNDQKIKEIKKTYSGKISKDIEAVYKSQFEDFSRTVNKKELYFDESIQNYGQKILNEIISSNSDLKDKNLAVYFSRDPEANAYSIGDGTIIFNLELLKYLNDEAEIGFTICHEIAHYTLNHREESIKKEITAQNSKEAKALEKEIKKSKFNKLAKSESFAKDKMYSRKNKSRNQEFQADSLGFSYFKNTRYNTASSINLLKHLSQTDIETDSLPRVSYPKNFNTKNQKFIKDWVVMEDYSKYSYSKDNLFKWDVDSLKTHPDCEQRIEKIKKLIIKSKTNYYTDKAFFDDLKKRIDYEQIYSNYYTENYGKSLYETLKLKEKNQKNMFLKEMINSNLTALAKAKKEMRINSYIPLINPNEQTKSQQYYFNFVSNLTLSELEQLASDYKN
ncbi:putative Zn-dependent protease [Flavobacterium sp. HSC-32F16]|uniref:M48 family metalloprotease n=1 Tax=Flavobacterium sp. HSC-32F16 TaxID=2910964 RepID=UPI0020A29B15|nr:M48 family metalloprotease [Flavobacterium sp. HSC-32F16]MCP2026682.1 putative Zn-dependent protease [Flavobacterium sp. HSC-32F16]